MPPFFRGGDAPCFQARTLQQSHAPSRHARTDARLPTGPGVYEPRDPVLPTKGERQRVAIASAPITRPDVLILDEPTKALGHSGRVACRLRCRDSARKGERFVLTHSYRLVSDCARRAIMMAECRMVADDLPRDIFRHEDALQRAGPEVPQLVRLADRRGLWNWTSDGMIEEVRGGGAGAPRDGEHAP